MQFAGSGNLNKRCLGKNNTSGILEKEQKKLEKMVLESFKKGDVNLGDNEDILKQSTEVDKLILNEMLKTDATKSEGVIKNSCSLGCFSLFFFINLCLGEYMMFKRKVFPSDTLSTAVLDSIPDMVRIIGGGGKVLYANSILKSLGIEGGMCRKIPGSAGDCKNCIAAKCIKDKSSYSAVTRTKGKTFSLTVSPVLHNGAVYALEVIRDITQEQNLKEKLMANNSRMMNDLEVARSLQLSILRHNLPKIEGYQFCAEFLPCEALGGDMYDCFLAHDGRIIMYVADVSGHGVMPAMLTVYLRQEVFAQCKTPGIPPLEVLKNLQASFEELNTEESIYITIFLAALDPATGEFVYANAGHSVPPLVSGTDVRELFLSGTPICRWAGTHIREESRDVLRKGERLFLYTDGLDGIHTGFSSNEKLKQILLDPKLKGKGLLDEIKKKFTQTRADDVTMVLCERE